MKARPPLDKEAVHLFCTLASRSEGMVIRRDGSGGLYYPVYQVEWDWAATIRYLAHFVVPGKPRRSGDVDMCKERLHVLLAKFLAGPVATDDLEWAARHASWLEAREACEERESQ